MEQLHRMIAEDEILFCGIVMLLGAIVGALARLAAGLHRHRIV